MQNTKIKTDHTLRELYTLDDSRFPFGYYLEDISVYENRKLSSHWHPEFEFGTVRSGRIIFHISSKSFELQVGQSIFINSGIIHSMSAEEHAVFENIVFPGNMIAAEKTTIYEKYIYPFMQSDIAYLIFDNNSEWHILAINILKSIYEMCQNGITENDLDIHIKICSLWQLIFKHRNEAITGNQVGISSRVQIRLRKMLLFIEENYPQKITLRDIAHSASICKSEATRCFHLGVGSSPLNYANEYRLHRAKEFLLTSVLSVSEIALNCGFDNCSYFDKQFKNLFGVTPAKFRKAAK